MLGKASMKTNLSWHVSLLQDGAKTKFMLHCILGRPVTFRFSHRGFSPREMFLALMDSDYSFSHPLAMLAEAHDASQWIAFALMYWIYSMEFIYCIHRITQ